MIDLIHSWISNFLWKTMNGSRCETCEVSQEIIVTIFFLVRKMEIRKNLSFQWGIKLQTFGIEWSQLQRLFQSFYLTCNLQWYCQDWQSKKTILLVKRNIVNLWSVLSLVFPQARDKDLRQRSCIPLILAVCRWLVAYELSNSLVCVCVCQSSKVLNWFFSLCRA